MFRLGNAGAELRRYHVHGAFGTTGLSLAIVPSHQGRIREVARFSLAGDVGVIETDLETGQSGWVLRCRLLASPEDLSKLRRHLTRAENERRSGRVMAGLVLLLALCGWIDSGEEGVRRAISLCTPPDEDLSISSEAMRCRFGARPLYRHEIPALFEILQEICRRASLRRLPDIYYIPSPHSMNAYALGGPESAAIAITEGLLRGMSRNEVTGILAHEVAHIRNNDGSAMRWAATLHRAIALTSLVALTSPQTRSFWATTLSGPMVTLLRGASLISHLLCLALSRIRELDADALALDLTDDPEALIAALRKLERHHSGSLVVSAGTPADGTWGFLRSHPETWERLGRLADLRRPVVSA